MHLQAPPMTQTAPAACTECVARKHYVEIAEVLDDGLQRGPHQRLQGKDGHVKANCTSSRCMCGRKHGMMSTARTHTRHRVWWAQGSHIARTAHVS